MSNLDFEQTKTLVQQVLGDPTIFPEIFGAWMQNYLSLNPPVIPIAQVSGYVTTLQECRVHSAANVSIANNNTTAMTWDTKDFDKPEGNIFSSGANTRLTCRVAGRYLILAGIAWAPSTAGTSRDAIIKMNGTTQVQHDRRFPSGSAINIFNLVFTVQDMAVGNYAECMVYQDTGGNLNVVGGAESNFAMFKIG